MKRDELITELSNELKAILRNDLSYFACEDTIKGVSDISICLNDESCIGITETIAFGGEVELWIAVPHCDEDKMSQRYSISGTAIVKDLKVEKINKPLTIKKK